MEFSEAEAIKALQEHGIEPSLKDYRTTVEIANDMIVGSVAANETIVISPVSE
jgi:uncharacterized protein YqgV (UPF0045/DUF77 family)